MISAFPEEPVVGVAAVGRNVAIPDYARGFHPVTIDGRHADRLSKLPSVTLIRTGEPDLTVSSSPEVRALFARRKALHSPSVFLFEFRKPARVDGRALALLLAEIMLALPSDESVEFAVGVDAAASSLIEALAKAEAHGQRAGRPLNPSDPLGSITSLVAATADLRTESGRLSARAVAEVFGMPVAELASILGKTKQAVQKTPDAVSLQPGLLPLEQIARLRAILKGEAFRKWLNMPSSHMELKCPLETIRQGEAPLVAELAEAMLAGNPS